MSFHQAIFVDTSVWIEFLRGSNTAIRDVLGTLLDDDLVALAVPVRIELLACTKLKFRSRLSRLLQALPTYEPTSATWKQIETWLEDTTPAGWHFGMGDLLIASIAKQRGGVVWSLDNDFKRLEKLGFVTCYSLPSRH